MHNHLLPEFSRIKNRRITDTLGTRRADYIIIEKWPTRFDLDIRIIPSFNSHLMLFPLQILCKGSLYFFVAAAAIYSLRTSERAAQTSWLMSQL